MTVSSSILAVITKIANDMKAKLTRLGSTTDNAIYRADGTTGGIQGSAATISDDGITLTIGDAADNIVSVGVNNDVTGVTQKGVVLGANNIATGFGAAAIGVDNEGGGRNIGFNNSMSNGDGIGRNNIGEGISMGSACSSHLAGIAMGSSAQATASNSFCVGQFSSATDVFATSFGSFSNASGFLSFALGVSAIASGNTSYALGRSVTASAANSSIIGIGQAGIVDNATENSLMFAYDNTNIVMTSLSITASSGQVLDGDGSLILPDVVTPPDAPASGVTTYSEGGLLKTKSALGDGVQTSLIYNSGRWYCNSDNRWVTDSDDNYGANYYQIAESGGTGVNPITEWEHMGVFIPAGRTVHKLHFAGRANNSQVTDLEIHAILRRPNTADVWETGLNSDAEDNDVVLHRDFFYNPVDPAQTAFTNAMTHTHKRTIEINQAVEEDSFLSIYLRPVGEITAIRYFLSTYTWEII